MKGKSMIIDNSDTRVCVAMVTVENLNNNWSDYAAENNIIAKSDPFEMVYNGNEYCISFLGVVILSSYDYDFFMTELDLEEKVDCRLQNFATEIMQYLATKGSVTNKILS